MSIESLIHEILQLNDKIDADIGLSSRLEESSSKSSMSAYHQNLKCSIALRVCLRTLS
jgi:hypothetical protein